MVHYSPLNIKPTFLDLWSTSVFRMNLLGGILLMWIAGPLVYMAFDNQPPYTYLVEQSFIRPPTAKGGEEVLVMWKVIFNRSCPGSTQRMLFDPATKVQIASYDPAPAATTASLKDGYLNRAFLLPKGIQPGWVGYRATVRYHCNWLQRFYPLEVTTPDLFFKVEE